MSTLVGIDSPSVYDIDDVIWPSPHSLASSQGEVPKLFRQAPKSPSIPGAASAYMLDPKIKLAEITKSANANFVL